MNAVTRDAAWRESGSAGVFVGVANGQVPAALWRRALPDDLRVELAAFDGHAPFRHRAIVDPLAPALAVDVVLSGLGGATARPALARDLRQLVWLVAQSGFVPRSLRFEKIVDDGCRLFHADRVAARALCTYLGEGTEVLPASAADRGLMGHGDNRHVRDPEAIQRTPVGAVLLMRGDLSAHGPGVLHRSPPNAAGRPRLLAAVDA
jgi:hypothetical protein